MILTLGALSANVVLDASFVISFIRSKINADGEIIDTDAKTKISEAFNIFLDEL